MTNTTKVSAAAIVAALSAALSTQAQVHPEKPTYKVREVLRHRQGGPERLLHRD